MFKNSFENLEVIKEFKRILSEDKYRLFVYNSSINHDYLLAYNTFLSTSSSVIYVASNIYKATLAYEAFVRLAGVDNVNLYIMDDLQTLEVLATSNEYKYERLYTIESILNNKKKIIVTNLSSILRDITPLSLYKDNIISIKEKDIIDIDNIKKVLVESGYKRNYQVENIGEFAIRGEVIDVYPLNSENPIRIDLFDNEVEYIKTFDIENQKTKEKIKNIDIYPVNEIIYSNPQEIVDEIKKDIKTNNINETLENDLKDIENYNVSLKLLKYISYINDTTSNFLSFLDEKIVFFEEVKKCFEVEQVINNEAYNLLEDNLLKDINISLYKNLFDIIVKLDKVIYLNEFHNSVNGLKLDKTLDLKGYPLFDYNGNLSAFANEVKNSHKTIVVGASSFDRLKLLEEVFKTNDIKYNNNEIKEKSVNIIDEDIALSVGFIDNNRYIEYISDSILFKKLKQKEIKYRSSKNIEVVNSKDDIAINEYVVHFDYGIGKYLGIKTVELNNIINDYLIIKYQNMELYLPVENINMLSKYQGSEGVIPKLSKIGTSEWKKKKDLIREKLATIANDLIRVEAIREKKKGFKYLEDDSLQEAFENDFLYEETKDQELTVKTIKKDMEQGKIIDRLVCGDVGYGKTEVAMRIAFKTVMNGKQVAYLAPTTILTRQHYYTFKDRFEKYGINVALINRFVSDKEIESIIKKLKDGSIDIIIGTHALLTDKIRYKDLGLLIVDEEQRFGVLHKEKIKQYKETINVLTLSATPIPRTLQMSLVGVRELSLMSTPPKNRYPIKTYVLEKNDVVIREAIYNEIARGGQVFYLYNRIADQDKVLRYLKDIVPESRIALINGKMDKTVLEDIIQSFIDKEYDILLCTTIIETGIDIPNTNTLIVEGADRLGLAQMYQIRGRVGRSNRVSYAYFIYDKAKVLTDNSVKRLNAIKEFTTLGSGYKIALRDLAIRGAGDILGKEQSGFIDTIGLDLYMRLLQEEINKVKGIKEEEKTINNSNIEVSKHVDDTYVSDDEIKIYIHTRIASIKNKEEKKELIDELIDRFGSIKEDILLYIEKKYFDVLSSLKHVEKVRENISYISFNFTEKYSSEVDASNLFMIATNISNDFSFEYKARKIFIKLLRKNNMLDCLRFINKLLEEIN